MIDALTITNVYTGAAVTLNDLNYPVSDFSTSVDANTPERLKQGRHGAYTTPTTFGMRNIHIEGSIMGNGANDAARYGDYITKRRALLNAVMPRNERFYDESCTLDILFTGMSEHVTINCTVDGYPEMPLTWDTGTRGGFQLNLKAFDPRFYGAFNTVSLPHNVPTTVTNSGELEVYPFIQNLGGTTNGVTQWQFRWGTGSGNYRYVTYSATMPSGANYFFDFDKPEAHDSALVNIGGNISVRDWWALEPGANTVTYIGSGGTPAGTAVSILYRSAYML